ncbi:MAG: BadF/BadG/BcrA/BcrD ATPase family protein [Paracoccaceae bacterium]
MEIKPDSLIVVVDGGGSTCRVSVCAPDGSVLGHAVGGSANIATDFEGALVNILDTSKLAYNAAGLSIDRIASDVAYLGLAGAGLTGVATRMENALGFGRSTVVTDWHIMVQGALGDADGTVVLIGTGSFFVTRCGGKTRHIGGWGFQLGDDGGGAILGRNLLRKTVLAYDGVIEHSPLTRSILERFGGTPQQLLEFVQTATPMDYGSFAPALIGAFKKSDPIATEIVTAESSVLISTLNILDAKSTGRLCMLGGLGPTYQALLPAEYQAMCRPPIGDALTGAIDLAQRQLAEGIAL